MFQENLQQYKFSDYDYGRDLSRYGTFRSQNVKGSGRHGLPACRSCSNTVRLSGVRRRGFSVRKNVGLKVPASTLTSRGLQQVPVI
jgi:hypothetical protein